MPLFRITAKPRSKLAQCGFTLVELAIVLGIAGLLFGGLWRLMAGGNQQLRDQAAASLQTQVISSTKGYLASSQGQTFLGTVAANGTAQLALPTVAPDGATNAACIASLPAAQNLICNFLPAGFVGAGPNATTNPYGQTFVIRVLKDSTAAPNPPNTYSFVVMSTGGDVIPDSSGGRIAAAIGGDGGFIYTNSVCGAPAPANEMACGAFGAWSVNLRIVYGFVAPTAPTSGAIVTRTYVSPLQDSNLPWLARQIVPAGTAFNTMTTNFYMGGNANTMFMGTPVNTATNGAALDMGGGSITMRGGNITTNNGSIAMGAGTIGFVGSPSGITMGGAPITMGGGSIDMGNGSITLGSGSITGTPGSSINMSGPNVNPVVNVSSGCNKQAALGGPLDASCQYALQVNGDANVVNFLNVNSLYAQSFIYQSSDRRLKMNIKPLENSLDDIMRIKPVSYNLKASGKESMGVIAQDVEKIYPQLVTQNGEMKAVNYEGLIAPMINAIQQLRHENDNLRQRLDAAERRQEKIERANNRE